VTTKRTSPVTESEQTEQTANKALVEELQKRVVAHERLQSRLVEALGKETWQGDISQAIAEELRQLRGHAQIPADVSDVRSVIIKLVLEDFDWTPIGLARSIMENFDVRRKAILALADTSTDRQVAPSAWIVEHRNKKPDDAWAAGGGSSIFYGQDLDNYAAHAAKLREIDFVESVTVTPLYAGPSVSSPEGNRK
jgi:hypothetical protein